VSIPSRHPSWDAFTAPAPPAPRPRRPVSRPGLHLALALATLGTLAVAGGLFWDPLEPPIETFGELLGPGRLLDVLLAGRWYALWAFVILGAHEMGHYLACRRYGIPATLPFFLPSIPPIGTFGAVIRIRGAIPDRRALFDIAAAGPIAGFLVTLPVLVYGVWHAVPFVPTPGFEQSDAWQLGEPVLLRLMQPLLRESGEMTANGWIGAGWIGLLVTSLNLFPVGQLDGGHAAYAISRRLHRVLARATPIGLFGVMLVQVFAYGQFPAYAVWLVVLLWMRDRHPRLLDEVTPLGPGRKIVGLALAVIFALSFIVVPLYVD